MFEGIGPLSFVGLPTTSFVSPGIGTVTAPYSTGQTGGKDMDWGSIFGGATGGAATGAVAGGPIGAGIGAVLGGLGGLSDKGASGSMPGLGDALTLGLGSLFGGGKSAATPMVITQTQNVNQATQVDVQNVLGRAFGGGVTEDGTFDVFKTLGDVFTLRDAMTAAATSGDTVVGGVSSVPTTTTKTNWTPIILIGGGVLALFLFMRKGK